MQRSDLWRVVLSALIAGGISGISQDARAADPPPPATTAAAPVRVVGVRDVLESIRGNNAAIAAARAAVDVADADVERAWTAWQPRLNAIGSLTFNSVEQKFDQGDLIRGLGFALSQALPTLIGPEQLARLNALDFGEPVVISPHVQFAGLLTLNQTLFNISALRAPGVAKAARRAAEAGTLALEDELLFTGATLYSTLAGLKALEGAADRAITVAEKRISDATAQVEAGTATKIAVTRAETDRVVAIGQRTSLLAQRRSLLATLAALMASPEPVEVETRRLEEAISLAKEPGGYEQRGSIQARTKALEAAEKAVGLVNMNWMPTLAAEGQLRYANVKGFSDDNLFATASINLVIPIYDQGVRYADLHAAEARVARARSELENERNTARAFVEEARAKLESARSELAQAEAQFKLATEAVQQVEALAANGLATNLELTDADQKRYAADQLIAQKTLELDLALLRRYYALGGKLLEPAK